MNPRALEIRFQPWFLLKFQSLLFSQVHLQESFEYQNHAHHPRKSNIKRLLQHHSQEHCQVQLHYQHPQFCHHCDYLCCHVSGCVLKGATNFKQLLHLNIVLIRFTKNICEHECGHHPSHEYHWKTQPCQTLLFPNFNLASQHRNLVSIKTMLITLARVISKDSSNIFSVSLSDSTSFSTYTVLSSL